MSSSEKAPLVEDSDPGLAQVIASVESRTQNLELRTANGEPTLSGISSRFRPQRKAQWGEKEDGGMEV